MSLMLRRKILDRLAEWKANPDHLPLLIDGARQVGKTTAVREFSRSRYKVLYELNFLERPELISIFDGDLDPSSILTSLSVAFPDRRFEEGSTLIFLDEIQHCPNGRTALKFLARDPRFDVIASGSLLGINHAKERSFPVGYVQGMDLQPLDFEEFLWAMGISEDIIGHLRDCFERRRSVESFIHTEMLSYFTAYMMIGGMPAVVAAYAASRDYSVALAVQRDIIEGYKRDVVKYAEEPEKVKILRTFDSITSQLAKDHKKFQYSGIEKGARARSYGGALLWLKDAGIVSFCHNLSSPQLPLSGFAIDSEFKVYMNDTGLLVSMYEDGTAYRLFNGDLGLFKGAFYENVMAQSLRSMGFPLFYFSPSDSLEIDFVIVYRDRPCIVEVKSGENKKSKSLNTLMASDRYGVDQAIRLSRNNIGEKSGILSIPLYMIMFLRYEKDQPFELAGPDELRKHIDNDRL